MPWIPSQGVCFPVEVQAGAPTENSFSVILISADRLWWQQILHLCHEKWGYGMPCPKSGVYQYPLYINYAYE